MKKQLKRTIFTLFLLTSPLFMFAQSGTIESAYDSLTMEGQFDHLFKSSNRYEDYKVMRMSAYDALKKNAIDSMKVYSDQVQQLQKEIDKLNLTISQQADTIQSYTSELDETKMVQDSMSFFGMHIMKDVYNTIMWGLIICLLALSAVLFSLFKRGHSVVRATKKRLDEVQDELENHRKNALVREQKLARELMDVKLKHKSSR